MTSYTTAGLFTLTILVVGLGLIALRHLSGWWCVVLATGVSVLLAVVRVAGSHGGPGWRDDLAWALTALMPFVGAVTGERLWRGVLRDGRRIAPLTPDVGTRRSWGLGALALVALAAAAALLLNRPSTVLAGVVQPGVLALALLALGHRLRVGWLLVLATQVFTVVQIVTVLVVALPSYTGLGLTGLLVPAVLQVVAVVAVALWGRSEWATRERSRPAAPVQGSTAAVR
ncbi:hypothetical protein [Arsenicicoccus dermatophilus]|uniref:hypothetical protein n=1 Tax=Arsenicicoccus dermatophilus TaxID=1076331 RepID=UPI001F4CBB08|nr:hypothetical protein [Arsenicicoccus dermatophilus]MCH8613900.1 hypothetical protein [Arsenicicoccus dermatophilus]